MPEGQVLEFSRLTKRFGAVAAVSGLSARVEPGVVTGFLGPNGAGKTTTLRTLLGLIHADEGTATIGGTPYRRLRQPLQTVGAVLEASSFHPGRSAAGHLKVYAHAAGIPAARIDEVLGIVGLTEVAGRKVGGFSLGMRQRLGLAYALLGDPGVLVLDEPANGLDPEGIKWLRGFLRELARQGRTVLVSSHLLAEVQQTVDSLLIIAQGRLVFQGGLDDLTDPSEYTTVVDSPDRAALTAALHDADIATEVLRSGLNVRGADPAAVGLIAAAAGVPLSLLQRKGPALEEVFLDLVNGVRVHASADGVTRPRAGTDAAAAVIADAEPAVAEAAPEAVAGAAVTAVAGAAVEPGSEGLAGAEAGADGQAGGAAADPAGAGASTESADAADAAGPVDAADPTGGPDVVTAADALETPDPFDTADVPDVLETADVIDSAEVDDPDGGDWVAPSDDPLDDVYIDAADADALDETTEGGEAALADDPGDDDPGPDRPWENQPKTEADLEADRFFAAFDEADAEGTARADAEGETEGSAATEAEASVSVDVAEEPAAEAATEEGEQR